MSITTGKLIFLISLSFFIGVFIGILLHRAYYKNVIKPVDSKLPEYNDDTIEDTIRKNYKNEY